MFQATEHVTGNIGADALAAMAVEKYVDKNQEIELKGI